MAIRSNQKAFKARYKQDPPYQAAESSAGVLVYADAIQRAKSLDTEKVRNAIAATENAILLNVYGNLLNASYNHLRAFVAQLEVVDGR